MWLINTMLVNIQNKKAVLVDVAIPSDSNIRNKAYEMSKKYRGLKKELERILEIKALVVIGALWTPILLPLCQGHLCIVCTVGLVSSDRPQPLSILCSWPVLVAFSSPVFLDISHYLSMVHPLHPLYIHDSLSSSSFSSLGVFCLRHSLRRLSLGT